MTALPIADDLPLALGAKEILGMSEVVAGSAVRWRSRAGEGSNRPRRER